MCGNCGNGRENLDPNGDPPGYDIQAGFDYLRRQADLEEMINAADAADMDEGPYEGTVVCDRCDAEISFMYDPRDRLTYEEMALEHHQRDCPVSYEEWLDRLSVEHLREQDADEAWAEAREREYVICPYCDASYHVVTGDGTDRSFGHPFPTDCPAYDHKNDRREEMATELDQLEKLARRAYLENNPAPRPTMASQFDPSDMSGMPNPGSTTCPCCMADLQFESDWGWKDDDKARRAAAIAHHQREYCGVLTEYFTQTESGKGTTYCSMCGCSFEITFERGNLQDAAWREHRFLETHQYECRPDLPPPDQLTEEDRLRLEAEMRYEDLACAAAPEYMEGW